MNVASAIRVNASITPTIELGVTTGFVKSDQRFPQSDGSPFGMFAAARESPGFNHAGLGYTNIGALGENPQGYTGWIPSEMFQDLNTQSLQRESMAGTASWHPLSWMANDATAGVDYATFTDFNVCRSNECLAFGGLRGGSNYSRATNARSLSAKIASVSTWNARPNLNIKTTVGSDYANIESDYSSAVGVGLPPGAQNVSQAAARTNAANLSPTVGMTLGVFIQEQALLHDRLFATVGMRSDQNSAFGSNHPWIAYPKASVSWLLSEESFFPTMSWLDQFRGRVAYGASGTQPGLTSAFKTYAPITSSINGTDTQGLIGNQSGNPDIKPERTAEFETGFDARVFKRVNLELAYLRKKTTGVLERSRDARSERRRGGGLAEIYHHARLRNRGRIRSPPAAASTATGP